MRRKFFTIYLLLAGLISLAANAGVYRLNDGGTVSGDPISYNETGLIVRESSGTVSSRISWEKFTEDSLRQLLAEAKNPKDKGFIEPLLEDTVEQKAEQKQITIKEVAKPARPTKGIGLSAGFSSPIFLVIFLILYAANLYAAFEIALYKYQPAMVVCGVSAVAPLIGPIIFLCLPAKADPMRDTTADAPETTEVIIEEVPILEATIEEPATTPVPSTHAGHSALPATPLASHPSLKVTQAEAHQVAAPILPAPIVFSRGEFSFNRRFFETKLAGFFRVVPGEAEKDMVIVIKSLRGDFIGKRISRVTQTELYLQVFKDEATHDEMIPFTEVQEVRVRHKNSA